MQSRVSMLALIAAMIACAATGWADETTDAQQQAMMTEIMEKYATPGDQHKLFEPMVGRFNYVTSYWMYPGASAEQSNGSAEYSWAHGGRYLMQTVTGDMMGTKFEGTGILGYDRFNDKVQSFWIDNMGTGFMMDDGVIDETGKVMTFEGTGDDVWRNQRDAWRKSVLTIDGNDKHRLEMFVKAEDGTEYKHLEIVYERADVAGGW